MKNKTVKMVLAVVVLGVCCGAYAGVKTYVAHQEQKESEEIMKLLEQINDRGTTVLVVTHNKEIVNAMKKRVVTMHEGSIISDEKEGEYHEA